jgi:hypothetical protein
VVENNFIDDFFNLIDVAVLKVDHTGQIGKKIAVLVNNRHKYLGYSLDKDHQPKLRMTEQIKLTILKEFYSWEVVNVDEKNVDQVPQAVQNIVQ